MIGSFFYYSNNNNYDRLLSQQDDEILLISPIVAALLWLGFGILSSFLSTLFLCLSLEEHKIIQNYNTNGQVISGDVICCTYARGSIGGKQEYICIVEYDYALSTSNNYNTTIRVRKQISSLLATDVQLYDSSISKIPSTLTFLRQSATLATSSSMLIPPQLLSPSITFSFTQQLISPSYSQQQRSFHNNIEVEEMRNNHAAKKYLDLVVLPQNPNSGYPEQHLLRKSNISYRLSLGILPCFFLLLTAICIYGAATSMIRMERTFPIYQIVVGTVFVYGVEFAILTTTCPSFLSNIVDQEYFQVMEQYIVERCEDSTISSVATYNNNNILDVRL